MCDLHRLGACLEEIAAILKVNVYFVDKRGNSDAALVTEISRILNKQEFKK